LKAVIKLLGDRLRNSTCQQEKQFVEMSQLEEYKNEQARKLEIAEEMAHTDSLTGVYNRRHFFELSSVEMLSAETNARALCVLMLDADHFKKVNDMHGHAAGDAVLKHIVRICLGALRRNDFIGRLGGEEFAIVLPETTLIGAMATAERLRQSVEVSHISTEGKIITVTVSIGIATLEPSDRDMETLLDRADKALYQAKKEGRNRVHPWAS